MREDSTIKGVHLNVQMRKGIYLIHWILQAAMRLD